MADGEGSVFAKLRAFAARDWILILIGLAALVVAWLIYRNNQANSITGSTAATGDTAGYVPAGGAGQPNWPADGSGQNADFWNNFWQYIQSNQTPNPSPTATPSTTAVTTTPGYATSTPGQTLDQFARAHGTTATDLYYNNSNKGLRALIQRLNPKGGISKIGSTVLPTGTNIFYQTPQWFKWNGRGRNPGDPIGFM